MPRLSLSRAASLVVLFLLWPVTALAIDQDIDFSGITRFIERHSTELTALAIVAAVLFFLTTRNELGCLGIGSVAVIFCFSFVFLGWLAPIILLLVPVFTGRIPLLTWGRRSETHAPMQDVYVAPPVVQHVVRPIVMQPIVRHIVVRPHDVGTNYTFPDKRYGHSGGHLQVWDDQD